MGDGQSNKLANSWWRGGPGRVNVCLRVDRRRHPMPIKFHCPFAVRRSDRQRYDWTTCWGHPVA